MKDTREHIGFLIQDIRKLLNMKQSAFAELVGISQSSISKMERGLMNPKADLVVNITRKLSNNRVIRKKLYLYFFRTLNKSH